MWRYLSGNNAILQLKVAIFITIYGKIALEVRHLINRLVVIEGDITKVKVDAIVNAANSFPAWWGESKRRNSPRCGAGIA